MSEKHTNGGPCGKAENCLSAGEGALARLHFCFSSWLFALPLIFDECYTFLLVQWDDVALTQLSVLLNTATAV